MHTSSITLSAQVSLCNGNGQRNEVFCLRINNHLKKMRATAERQRRDISCHNPFQNKMLRIVILLKTMEARVGEMVQSEKSYQFFMGRRKKFPKEPIIKWFSQPQETDPLDTTVNPSSPSDTSFHRREVGFPYAGA